MGTGIPVPDTIPETSIGLTVCVPDSPFFMGVVMGAIKTMSFRYYWSGTEEQIDAVTARMTRLYYEYQEQLNCMDCNAVADCIETSQAVQNAIAALIQPNTPFPAQSPYGQNLSSEKMAENAAGDTNPGCDLDILWAQCLGTTQLIKNAISDVLQQVEVFSNVVELVDAIIHTIPAGGQAEDAAGVSGVLDLIQYYQNAIAEEFEAQYTVTPITGTEDVITFALFCACKADCVISIERIQAVFDARLSVYLAPPSIEGFVNLLEFMAGVEVDSSFVVDLTFWIAWKMVGVANLLFGQTANNILNIVLALKADEPSDNWELMGDCPEEFEHVFDFTIDEQGWAIHAPYGIYVAATGFQSNSTPLAWLYITVPDSGRVITSVTFVSSAGNQLLAQVASPEDALTYGIFDQPNSAWTSTTIDVSGATGFDAAITSLVCRPAVDGATTWTGTLVSLTVRGEGSDPF